MREMQVMVVFECRVCWVIRNARRLDGRVENDAER